MFEFTELPAIAGFVLLATQYIKKLPPFSRGKGKEFLPILAAVLGAISAIVYQIIFEGLPYDAASVTQYGLQGFIAGLTACGSFSFFKCTFIGKPKPEKPAYSEKGEM